MKVLLDQNVFIEIAEMLRQEGFEAHHTREFGLARAADEEILRYAAAGDWIIVTYDQDFHMLLAIAAAARPSVVRLRVMLAPAAMTRLIAASLRTFQQALLAGAAVTVAARGARAHRLPLH